MNNTNQPVNPSETPVQSTPAPLNNKRGFFLAVLGVLVLLVVVGSGAYYLGTQKNNASNQMYNTTPLPTITSNPTPIPNTTSLKTYTNTKYGYSINVPQDMKIVEENQTVDSASEATKIQSLNYEIDNSVCKGGCSNPIMMGWLLNIMVRREWQYGYDKEFLNHKPFGVLFEEEKTINGVKIIIEEVKRMDLPDLGNTDWCADIVDKGNLYRITYSANESQKYFSKETFYNMLSTFKFIN